MIFLRHILATVLLAEPPNWEGIPAPLLFESVPKMTVRGYKPSI
jgi:hypothetical protein